MKYKLLSSLLLGGSLLFGPGVLAGETDDFTELVEKWEAEGIDPNHMEVSEEIMAYIEEHVPENFAGRFIDREDRDLGILVYLFTEPLPEEHEENIYAMEEDPAEVEIRIVDYTEDDLIELQSQIDAGGFNYGDFEIIHTGTSITDGHVEVGINPYSEENASIIYDEFGDEYINVVEADHLNITDDAGNSGNNSYGGEADLEAEALNVFQRIAAWLRGLFN